VGAEAAEKVQWAAAAAAGPGGGHRGKMKEYALTHIIIWETSLRGD